jgi:type I restriction enzyme S subunit
MTQALPKDVPQTLRRWKRYPAYKDSGVEWLGEIPEHWEVKKIKRFCLVKRGASPRPIDDPIYFDDEGEYAWVRISDVTASKKYLLTTEQRLSEHGKSKSVPLEPSELFLSIAATVGKPIITAIKCCIHDGFVYFVGLKQNREYLFYTFLSGEPYKGLGKLGTQLNLNTDTIGDIRVPVPPEAEQQAIASFLDHETAKIDALIAKKERLIELLQEKRTAIISHAVTKGLDPTAPLKDSGVEWLGEIPAHWKCHLFRRVIQSMCDGPFGSDMKSSHYTNEGVRLIRLQNIGQGYFDNSDKAYIRDEHFLSLPGHDAAPGDLLIAGLGDQNNAVGRACLVPDDVNRAMVKADCFRIRLNQQQLLHIFAMYLLCSSIARAGVKLQTRGATRDRINLSGTAQLHVVIPPLDEQQAIASYIDRQTTKIDALIAKIREGIEKLKEYRTALISAAVTGKIDVRNEVA